VATPLPDTGHFADNLPAFLRRPATGKV
jgi:hypothetical protein